MIDAVNSMIKKGKKIRLVLSGSGELVPVIKEHLHIDFLGSIMPHNAYKFYQRIDLLVLPSQTRDFWNEQTCRAIIEAVASGRSVVGSSSGAIPEVMGHLRMPYVFKEDSQEALEAKIELAINDIRSKKAIEIVEKSRKLCLALYCHESMAKRCLSYFVGNNSDGTL